MRRTTLLVTIVLFAGLGIGYYARSAGLASLTNRTLMPRTWRPSKNSTRQTLPPHLRKIPPHRIESRS